MEICSIASGSSGNCIYAGNDHTHVLIDAGISKKRIVEGLNGINISPEDVQALFVTHEHVDHIQGLGVFLRKYPVPVYATGGTLAYIKRCRSLGNIDPSLFHEIRPDETISVGDLSVCPFRVSHDAADPVAYRFNDEKHSLAVVTDLGIYDRDTVRHLRGLDAVLLEANHDVCMLQVGGYPYPLKQRILGDRGHLSNELSGRLLCEILHDDMQYILLGHLSKENNMKELAEETVKLEVTFGDNPYKGSDFPIIVADREKPSALFRLS